VSLARLGVLTEAFEWFRDTIGTPGLMKYGRNSTVFQRTARAVGDRQFAFFFFITAQTLQYAGSRFGLRIRI